MYVLYKSKNILTLVTIGYIVGFIVGMYVEYCYGPKWPYWIYIAYIVLFGTGICRYCFWVELPVQRRLCRFSKVASGNLTSTCIPRVDG